MQSESKPFAVSRVGKLRNEPNSMSNRRPISASAVIDASPIIGKCTLIDRPSKRPRGWRLIILNVWIGNLLREAT